MVKNKRAQFKIQETAFMILGVVLFFILVGVFWLSLKSSGLNKNAAELKQQEATILALTISNTPELSCSKGTQCIDYDKALVIKNTRIIETLWPIKIIQIRKIWPDQDKKIVECNGGNINECNMITIENKAITRDSIGVASSFIKICKKEKNAEGYIYEKCEMGEIIIKT